MFCIMGFGSALCTNTIDSQSCLSQLLKSIVVSLSMNSVDVLLFSVAATFASRQSLLVTNVATLSVDRVVH